MSNINCANNRFLNQPVTQVSSNYTVSQLNDFIIEVTSTLSVVTITLPTPLPTGNVGKTYIIKDTSGAAQSNNIVITPASGFIDGAALAKISSNYGTIQVFCDGTNYYSFGSSNAGSFIVNERVFTSNGTYTPTAGMLYCEVEILGGGGGGGGSQSTTATTIALPGGGAGEYAFGVFSAATIGTSQSVTIGAGGSGIAGASGGNGGTTSLGSIMTANGGIGGITSSSSSSSFSFGGTLGGTGGVGGNYRTPGAPGDGATGQFGVFQIGGNGGSSQYGAGGISPAPSTSGAGQPGLGYGAGGGGVSIFSTAPTAGGAGSPGVVFITEYISTSSTSLPVASLAQASWNRQSFTFFTPGSTAVQTSFGSDPGTTPSNAGSRIDLSSLTLNYSNAITIAQFQVTITQAGIYQIIGNMAPLLPSGIINAVIQCVKNGTTVLAMGVCQILSPNPQLDSASFVVNGSFAIGDTIDFRVNTAQSSGFTFWALDFAITQIPSSVIVPITNWNPVSGTSQILSPNSNYYTQNSSLTTLTLPLASSVGTTIQIAGGGAGGWLLTQNTGQLINFGNQVTTTGTGGSIASMNQYDGITLLCSVANLQWIVLGSAGNLVVT
jgi:hypothetical protein